MSKINIMLVEDYQMVREGLRRMLEQEPDMAVLAEASSGEEALVLARTYSPDVVLMDIKMQGMNGIETTRLLKQEHPECRVVVLTLYDDYLSQAILSGADGYLLKDLRREELVRAIRDVWEGRSPLHLSLKQGQLGELVSGISSPSRYSERELTVLRLAASGAQSKEMAQQMNLSEATVKRTLRHICEKLGARNRSEAVAEAIKRNLI